MHTKTKRTHTPVYKAITYSHACPKLPACQSRQQMLPTCIAKLWGKGMCCWSTRRADLLWFAGCKAKKGNLTRRARDCRTRVSCAALGRQSIFDSCLHHRPRKRDRRCGSTHLQISNGLQGQEKEGKQTRRARDCRTCVLRSPWSAVCFRFWLATPGSQKRFDWRLRGAGSCRVVSTPRRQRCCRRQQQQQLCRWCRWRRWICVGRGRRTCKERSECAER